MRLTQTRNKRLPAAAAETDLVEAPALFETALREDFSFTGSQARDKV